MTNGTDILLLINDDAIAALTSNDFNMESEIKEITSKDSYGWKECKPTKRSFTASANGFMKGLGVNLIRSSENLLNSNVWNIGTNTITPNYASDFLGKKTADLITFTTDHITQIIPGVTISDYVTFSLYAKGSGTIFIKISNADYNTTLSITLTSTLTRYSVSFQSLDGVAVQVEIYKGTATSATIASTMVNIGQAALPYVRSGLVYDDLYTLYANGTKVAFKISDQIAGNKQYSASGYFKSIKQTDPVEDIATFSCTIEGTAELIKSTI